MSQKKPNQVLLIAQIIFVSTEFSANHFKKIQMRLELTTNPDTTMYSFSVRLHQDTELSDAPCVYEWVDLNIGDGYDEFSGNTCFDF